MFPFLQQDTTQSKPTSITFKFKSFIEIKNLEERCIGQLIFQHVEGILLSCAPRERQTLLCKLIQWCSDGAEILHKTVIELHKA
jgi:hypothetical protein